MLRRNFVLALIFAVAAALPAAAWAQAAGKAAGMASADGSAPAAGDAAAEAIAVASGLPGFVLGPGDVLEVSVWKDESLTREVLVRPDGNISFPLIGDVRASGRKIEDLRAEIQTRVKEYVPDAPVTVLLSRLGSTRVFVVGKVAQPGMYMMPEAMSVMQVLGMAGGLTTFADTDGICILRRGAGGQEALTFNYGKVEKGRSLDENILLMPGDTIVVR